MLAFYRKRAGLPQKAEGYTGWDADGRQLTGHIAGHHLSAVSLMYSATGDARFKQRADYLVDEIKTCQDANADGFAGALPGVKEAFADVSKGTIKAANFDLNGLWSPWYTLHKTFAGLRDAYRHTGNQTALDIEVKFGGWAEKYLAPMDDATIQRMLACEFGGMNEMMADLFADTGDKRWLDLSYKFEHKAVLDPLKRGDDPLSSLHGNTQVPKLVGSASRYAYAGNKDDLTAATVFWDRVVNHHTFATGGHGKDEYFREPDRLGNITEGRTAETCNVYNMLKLTRKLFALQPDIRYAEFHERALFNHILGSMDTRRRRHLLHGAGRIGRAPRIRRHASQLHVLRRHRDGESRAPWSRPVLRERQQALRQPLRAVDRAVGIGRRQADDGDVVSRRGNGGADA